MDEVTIRCNVDLLPIVEEIERLNDLKRDAMDFEDSCSLEDLDQLERELYSKGETE